MGAGLNGVLSLIGVGAALWALSIYGSEDAAKDEVITWLSVTAVCLVGMVLQYLYWLVTIPVELDKAHRGEIRDLKQRLAPKLSFVWRPYDNKFLEETQLLRGQQRRTGKIGRIAIKNESKSETVCGVHVSLVNYSTNNRSEAISVDRRLIGINAGAITTDLHASREETFEVFRIYEGKATLRLAPYDKTEVAKTLSKGTYKLKITASATGMSRLDEYYFLRFDDYHKIEFRPWAHGDVLTQNEQSRTL